MDREYDPIGFLRDLKESQNNEGLVRSLFLIDQDFSEPPITHSDQILPQKASSLVKNAFALKKKEGGKINARSVTSADQMLISKSSSQSNSSKQLLSPQKAMEKASIKEKKRTVQGVRRSTRLTPSHTYEEVTP